MRPIYETRQDKYNEVSVAQYLTEKHGGVYVPSEELAPFDGVVVLKEIVMKPMNFMGAESHEPMHLLCHCWAAAFDYEQTAEHMADDFDIYLPKDQWDALCKVFDIQVDLDIGGRKKEVTP